MIELYSIEIEFLKVFCIGVFVGWQARKYFHGHGKYMPWTEIKNMKYSFMDKRNKK